MILLSGGIIKINLNGLMDKGSINIINSRLEVKGINILWLFQCIVGSKSALEGNMEMRLLFIMGV